MKVLLSALIAGAYVLPALAQEPGTCSENRECTSGCCSTSGHCGFGPEYCGEDVCMSTCDAVAECGEYAATPGTTCPLNVCCSKHGFCGTTSEFCDDECQNGCDPVVRPSCGGQSTRDIYIGYYESWNRNRPCDVILPERINVQPWTHLYYSFALINGADSTITTMNPWDEEDYVKFNALKKKKPSLKTYIAVGGWDAGGETFSAMVRFPGTRRAFIQSSLEFMERYGFDGIEIDWEYPVAPDRGGNPLDKARLVTFMKELKEACGDRYGVTITLPASYWYLQGFDVEGMLPYVDYYNVMSYDIHGTWDGDSEHTEPVINPHTNLTEIAQGLDLLWRNNVDPGKVNLGLAFYGRSFKLDDSSCNVPGCPFHQPSGGGANPGSCTGTSGILSNYEVHRILENYDPDIVYDAEAGVNWITWANDQWISFDNARTLRQKADFANGQCLSGLFSWAIDFGGPGSLTNPNDLSLDDTSMDGAEPDGSSGGSGDIYIGQEVYNDESPSVTCVPPCNFILPPYTLATPTTITFPLYTTSLEVAWSTVITTTIGGTRTVTNTVARTIQTTTITIPPITTDKIDVWHWNITELTPTVRSYQLTSSILPPPIMVTDRGLPATHPSVTRMLTLPPFPYESDVVAPNLPEVTWTAGPPGPTCTTGCGRRCNLFCAGPCLRDCDGKGNDFQSPVDPDRTNTNSKCKGPDCVHGECIGPLCLVVGCLGSGCDQDNGICLARNCVVRYCTGGDCDKGQCRGANCLQAGCVGRHCNGNGGCFGLHCISWGCIGLDCFNNICNGDRCTPMVCSGSNCEWGKCVGAGCKPEDKDCEAVEADLCTKTIQTASPDITSSTVRCRTITACSATATTVTTTVDEEAATMTVSMVNEFEFGNQAVWDSIAQELLAEQSSWMEEESPTTTTTTRTTTSRPEPTATPTDYSCKGSPLCGHTLFDMEAFCDQAKAYLTEETIYGTTDSTRVDGTCYTDGANLSLGCKVFVEGDDCEMTGNQMAAAYDHLRHPDLGDCEICGSVSFSDGCRLKVDYVSNCSGPNSRLLDVSPEIIGNVSIPYGMTPEDFGIFSVPSGGGSAGITSSSASSAPVFASAAVTAFY